MQELTRRNVGPTLSTRAMALVGAAMHDATVATWDSKYTFNRKRPSEQDPAIVPRVSVPLSPAYPSEQRSQRLPHRVYSGSCFRTRHRYSRALPKKRRDPVFMPVCNIRAI